VDTNRPFQFEERSQLFIRTRRERLRESTCVTSLERAYAFPRERVGVTTLLLLFRHGPARRCGLCVASV